MIKVTELTKENESQYLDKIADLEEITLEVMKKEGREGQLFATGKEDISEYIHSDENTVIIATSENDELEGVTYVTQGQKPFTYNDITKYFKYGDKYKQYVKSQYQDTQEYKRDLLDIYKIKMQAFQHAKQIILGEYPEVKSIKEFLEKEVQENGFHEKSELREKLNRYMSAYVIENYSEDIQKKYQQFYWITMQDISEEFDKQIELPNKNVQEYEEFIEAQSECDEILQKGNLQIYEKPQFDETKYYSSNTENAIELDTYITAPNNRNAGIARIIVFEGIKKHMERHFSNPKNKEIFLCSTLHRDNLSSKYVSEFFGLTDNLYVKRRQGRDREVHICKISREESMEYLTSISDKLAVLYNYNPNQKQISESTVKQVLSEQLTYEMQEHERLKKAKSNNKQFNGINVKFIESKRQKIHRLKKRLDALNREGGDKSER
jgi:hypothetical protein